MVERYKVFEAELKGKSDGNPFVDVELKAKFSNGKLSLTTKGFYKGKGVYCVRFMPREVGKYTYITSSNDPSLDGKTGEFECVPASKNNHGRVLLKTEAVASGTINIYDNEDLFHFSYEDGTRFLPFGTTCYAWINQPKDCQERTLKVLSENPFNKVRMCIFPKHYTFNETDPENYAFEGSREKGFDLTRFNNTFWENLERRIVQLDDLGIQADVILLHPYDNWGFSQMTKDQDIFYLEYAVRRLSHFKNIWWSMANEYDLLPKKSIQDWETYAQVVMENDVYGHLRSIHNCIKFYDHSRPWITHCSLQRVDIYKTSEAVTEWRAQYNKPVVVDECAYEGNINYGWGNITGEELTRRFWEACIRGGYMTHGETYVDKGPEIWWAHGGVLHGTSQKRIAFCKKVFEDAPEGLHPLKLTMENHLDNWDVPCALVENKYYLYYFGFFRPCFRTYNLPEGKYQIDLIDTWEMTVKDLGTFSGKIKLEMPSKLYMAIRMRKVTK